jgi:hypothetical protein
LRFYRARQGKLAKLRSTSSSHQLRQGILASKRIIRQSGRDRGLPPSIDMTLNMKSFENTTGTVLAGDIQRSREEKREAAIHWCQRQRKAFYNYQANAVSILLLLSKKVRGKASIVMTIDQYQFRHSYHTTSSSLRIEFEENKVVIFVIILFWIGNVGATSQCFVKGLGQLRFLSHIDFVQDRCEVNWKTIT